MSLYRRPGEKQRPTVKASLAVALEKLGYGDGAQVRAAKPSDVTAIKRRKRPRVELPAVVRASTLLTEDQDG